jgi:hypothetical protein
MARTMNFKILKRQRAIMPKLNPYSMNCRALIPRMRVCDSKLPRLASRQEISGRKKLNRKDDRS